MKLMVEALIFRERCVSYYLGVSGIYGKLKVLDRVSSCNYQQPFDNRATIREGERTPLDIINRSNVAQLCIIRMALHIFVFISGTGSGVTSK